MDAPPLDLVIFGGAGDLSWRKLLPALCMAHLHGRLPAGTRIVGVGRHAWGRSHYADFVDRQSRPLLDASVSAAQWSAFLQRLDFVSLDAAQAEGYGQLVQACRPGADRVFYLATAPALFSRICELLHGAGLVNPASRVVLEKPLGQDLNSARVIHEAVGRYFAEHQIYRIDHYLGKETVQNLMVLRFGNAIFEPLWRAPHIRSVQITVAETVGVGTRAGFYDQTGALRDMVQNHLLQLLCIVAMEAPVSLDADAVRDEKLKVLRSLQRMTAHEVRRDTVRGQYTEGAVQGRPVCSYRQEPGVPPESLTETFVALRLQLRNARWAGVPFFLRTGKRLPQRRSEIIIDYADPPFSIFHEAAAHANRLVITLQPEESIRLQMMAKEPGSGMNLKPAFLNLDLQSAFSERRAEAYERLLIDVIKGRLTHFMRRDELEAAWQWVDPIAQAWQESGDPPRAYPAGSWGPAAASALVARDKVSWAEAT